MAVQFQEKPRPIFDQRKYIEYQPGTLNLILSVPHGGSLKPSSIRNRDAGAVINGQYVYDHKLSDQKDFVRCKVRYKQDVYTMEIATMVADNLQMLTGKRPHIVINHLYRGKMDPNVDLDKGAFGEVQAVEAWHSYQSFIAMAKESIKGPGLFLDIHGQVHPEKWVELGYTLSGAILDSKEYTPNNTSVWSLAKRRIGPGLTLEDLIYGPWSLGGLLATEGYNSVPSPQNPSPGGKNYYTGGYITIHHGSKFGGAIDAIQIECPEHVRKDKTAGKEFSAGLARAVYKYLQLHYNLSASS